MSAREGMSGARKLPSLNKQIIRFKDEEKSFVYESHEEDSDEY